MSNLQPTLDQIISMIDIWTPVRRKIRVQEIETFGYTDLERNLAQEIKNLQDEVEYYRFR